MNTNTNTITIVNKTALVDCLTDNNRFGNKKLTADQIGAEDLRNWKDLVANLHKSAYGVYVLCENDEPTEEDLSALDMTEVYNSLRAILNQIGLVNGHKMFATTKMATLCVTKAGTGNGNWYAPEMQLTMSKLSNARAYLRTLEKAHSNEEAIKTQSDIIDTLATEVDNLKKVPDMWHKTATRTKPEGFRADFERTIARAIAGQKAKTWDELEAEDQKRREDRKAKAKANRQAKRAEAKKTESK